MTFVATHISPELHTSNGMTFNIQLESPLHKWHLNSAVTDDEEEEEKGKQYLLLIRCIVTFVSLYAVVFVFHEQFTKRRTRYKLINLTIKLF